MKPKSQQLQIRVTPRQKADLRHLAKAHGMDLSAFVLSRTLPDSRAKLAAIVRHPTDSSQWSYTLATLNDFLESLRPAEFSLAVQDKIPLSALPPYVANYVAALIELAARRKQQEVPTWLSEVEPLQEPYFASSLMSLRLHLLLNSPPVFRRRNLFVDSSLGDRV